jgi:hypothetical protein
MGSRGPARMPTKLRMLHGESRPSQIGYSTTQPATSPPKMPADLTPAAQAIWRRTLRDQAPGIISRPTLARPRPAVAATFAAV